MARSTRASRALQSLPPSPSPADPKVYRHKQETVARPEAGAAPRFRGKKEAVTYRYDSSLSPALDWDAQPAREIAAWLMTCIEEAARLPGQTFPERRILQGADGKPLLIVAGLQDALSFLKAMQKPFLDWAGRAERASFDVPTLPLFIHERLSTEAIIKTLEGHLKFSEQQELSDLFADPRMPMAKQVDAYSYKNGWVNRLILGDSLIVLNSLVQYENLARQVQMIYMDPPYGVRFGSNFQPFVRERGNPGDNEDQHLVREPEMLQAYRDTWTLGIHSYLTYMRDRLLVCRELLKETGSIFVQISDNNVHHVREVMDDVFGADNFVSLINFQTTSGFETKTIATLGDYLLWYARNKSEVFVNKVFVEQPPVLGEGNSKWALLPDGSYRGVTAAERRGETAIPPNTKLYFPDNIQSQNPPREPQPFEFAERIWHPNANSHWKANYPEGMKRLANANRIHVAKNSIRYRRFHSDFPFQEIGNIWTDTLTGNFTDDKVYVVQTNTKVVERCLLLTTKPGNLVLDPTCGSGTTAYMAEHWGRRWITIDTSRVPLALTRQRLLTATYPWFQLKDDAEGPAAGFVYKRRQNRRGEEVGGIIPHIMLETIANGDAPKEEVLVDRPEVSAEITQVTGPLVVEALLPASQSPDESQATAVQDPPSDHIARMTEILRRSPNLRLPGGGSVALKNIRRPSKSLNLSAEAVVDHDASGAVVPLSAAVDVAHERNTGGLPFSSQPVAILFGPPNGAVTAKAVLDAAKEANVKGYSHLYVIGFMFTAEARAEIMAGEDALGLPASPVEITHDVLMGDLLKTQRSSQIFAITGSPEIDVMRLPENAKDGTPRWQVRLLGLDTFDPASVTPHHLNGDDVPLWMLDTGWNGMAFSAEQVFFPRKKAWDSLRKVLGATHEDSVWEHLAGDLSAPFAAEIGTEIAVKVLDDRGNELLKIHRLGA